MATDGPDAPPCDSEVYEKGTVVFVTHSISSNAMDQWIQRVALRSEQRVDWHFVGGRAVIKALGDIRRVKRVIAALMPEHDALYENAMREEFTSAYNTYGGAKPFFAPPRPSWWGQPEPNWMQRLLSRLIPSVTRRRELRDVESRR